MLKHRHRRTQPMKDAFCLNFCFHNSTINFFISRQGCLEKPSLIKLNVIHQNPYLFYPPCYLTNSYPASLPYNKTLGMVPTWMKCWIIGINFLWNLIFGRSKHEPLLNILLILLNVLRRCQNWQFYLLLSAVVHFTITICTYLII